MKRLIAMRIPSGYRTIFLRDGDLRLDEFEATYAMPAIVSDLISEGDVLTIDGPFSDMAIERNGPQRYSDIQELCMALPEDVEAVSIYDAVGCVPSEILGWNLLASDQATLVSARDTDGPWMHLRVGIAAKRLLAA